jgi:chemotaxis protein MotB
LQQARAQAAAEQSQLGKMQAENKWVVAGDVLFPEGGYQLSANGRQALNQYVPKLQGLQNAKIVVYGYTDNKPVGPGLQRAGIANNIDLSSRRADNVVAYLESQGINPNIISAKGFGDTHPVASNDTPDGRAQNRRIEIVMEGPGA